VQMGVPATPIDLQGKIEFQSQFFEPHGRFHKSIIYPAKYADFDLIISHPVGRWQIDTIAFVKQAEQFAPAPAAPPPPAASPAPSAPPPSSAPPAGSAPPGG